MDNSTNKKLETLISKVDKILAREGKQWLRTTEAAEYLGISTTQIHNFKREGVLPYTKLGGTLYFRKSDIDQLLEGNIQGVLS